MRSSRWITGAGALVLLGLLGLALLPREEPAPALREVEAPMPLPPLRASSRPEPSPRLREPSAPATPVEPTPVFLSPSQPRRRAAPRPELDLSSEDEVDFAGAVLQASRQLGESLARETGPAPARDAAVGRPSVSVACSGAGSACLFNGECCRGLGCGGAVPGYGVEGRCEPSN